MFSQMLESLNDCKRDDEFKTNGSVVSIAK